MKVRNMEIEDLCEAARLHKLSYERDHFTSRFSLKMLENLYRSFLKFNKYCLVVVDDNGVLEGIAIAGDQTKESIQFFIQKYYLDLIVTLIQNPSFIVNKFIALVKSKIKKPGFISTSKMRYLNLLVNPEFHGKGVGKELTDALEKRLKDDGIFLYGHSVKNNNIKTIKFHLKNNCVIEYEDNHATYFLKYL